MINYKYKKYSSSQGTVPLLLTNHINYLSVDGVYIPFMVYRYFELDFIINLKFSYYIGFRKYFSENSISKIGVLHYQQ